tara:strand:- start:488 stop:682 length:195 start_codon:yes stop_codon:yes gene_type:complete
LAFHKLYAAPKNTSLKFKESALMSKQVILERAAVAFSIAVICAGIWFWGEQIRYVLETLALAEA